MSDRPKTLRVAFQGEHGAFSEAAALQLLGDKVTLVPRPTFDSAFQAIGEGAAEALLVPIENTLAGSITRVYDLLLESDFTITAETILQIEHNVIGCPGATLRDIKTVASHPVALAQCERFFLEHPEIKRVVVEDTAGSVRDAIASGDKTRAGIAGRCAAEFYGGTIVAEGIQDNPENFTRFVLLYPAKKAASKPAFADPEARRAPGTTKVTLAMRLAHRPGSLLTALEVFARHAINLLKIESRPIHGRPWEYQFYLDVETDDTQRLEQALQDAHKVASDVRVLGKYSPARANSVFA